MFILIFFLLGLCFGYAVRIPWALLAFLFPLALAAIASDRSGIAMVVGFGITAIGIVAGAAIASRTDERTA
jgi:hypothetical protein